jgi:hypothetical protein
MNPVPGKGFAVSVLPITGGIMNCPAVFFQQQPNAPTIVPSRNLSGTRGDLEEVPDGDTILQKGDIVRVVGKEEHIDGAVLPAGNWTWNTSS